MGCPVFAILACTNNPLLTSSYVFLRAMFGIGSGILRESFGIALVVTEAIAKKHRVRYGAGRE
jgi:hypothetical protein